ncbi:hypothetical protein B0H17DRAFT_517480 [Mycena rosella]|uniref:FCP1 homology domain-containing protein n=1 Tax=Mycena rosella TaxID=1033263 RepID=A0AAD7MA52_MYCRO|nr:hypothetical protein B0H17DRAFT_517480 [Mycena rosella]
MSYAYYPYGGNQPFYNEDYAQFAEPASYAEPALYQQFTYADGYGGYGYAEYGTPARYVHPLPARPAPPPPRERTPTPPPAEPSPEYLAASLSPLPTAPPDQRKLLIFDLNGTLLLRSPRSYGSQRKIYLRPYARALVAYIAHPAVREWLDCMVWSSAQAHNVREMVERVFGADEGEGKGSILRAVWARDTLGLGRDAFYQKTQTTKDLAKPWAFFAALDVPRPLSPVYTPTSSPLSSPRQTSSSALQPPSSSAPAHDDDSMAPPAPPHGPETTLLVDDSPLKARLQPWNHLCVAEYAAPDRKRDLAAAGLSPSDVKAQGDTNGARPMNAAPNPTRDLAAAPEDEGPQVDTSWGSGRPMNTNARGGLRSELAGLEAEAAAAAGIDLGKDRWRKRRRGAAKEADDTEEVGVNAQEEGGAGEVPGVSKRARRRERKRLRAAQAAAGVGVEAEAEVGGDESSGSSASLSSSSPVRGHPGIEAVETEQQAGEGEPASSPVDAPVLLNVEDVSEVEAPLKKRKREEEEEDAAPQDVDATTDAPQDVEVEALPQDAPAPTDAPVDADADAPTDGEPYDATLLAVVGVLAHVRGVGNVAAWVRGGGLVADAGVEPTENQQAGPAAEVDMLPTDPAQWFAAPRLLHAWAARGRAALAELEINAAHGVE